MTGRKARKGGKNAPAWILASTSPRRHEILGRLGMRFEIVPSGIEEPVRKFHETPVGYAVRAARLKAEAAGRKHKAGMILGADTIVVARNRILGKPATKAEALRMLQSLSGRWHEVITGICLWDSALKRGWSASGVTRVHFRPVSNMEIEWYLKTGEYRDKAGAYGVQGYASLFIDRIEGCYFNVVGFPVALFEKLCRRAGIDLLRGLSPR